MLATLAACGDSHALPDASTVDALPRQHVSESHTLTPGMLIEGSWNAGPTDQIYLTMQSTEPIDWDIHGHANNGTQEIVDGFAQANITYLFAPTLRASWYLLLRNSTTVSVTIDIDMDLYNQALWTGFE